MKIELTNKQSKFILDKMNILSQMESQLQKERENLLETVQLLTDEDIPQQVKSINLIGSTLEIE